MFFVIFWILAGLSLPCCHSQYVFVAADGALVGFGIGFAHADSWRDFLVARRLIAWFSAPRSVFPWFGLVYVATHSGCLILLFCLRCSSVASFAVRLLLCCLLLGLWHSDGLRAPSLAVFGIGKACRLKGRSAICFYDCWLTERRLLLLANLPTWLHRWYIGGVRPVEVAWRGVHCAVLISKN